MSLLSYEDARPWAKSIKTKVVSREMPPWHADPRFGTFKNSRSLSQHEIDTIVAWVDGGAPRGNDADLPPAPKFAEGWQRGEPDHVIELPVEFQIPAEGEVPIQHFWVPIPFSEDRFAQALELRPGNKAVVHHSRADVASVPRGGKIVNGELIFADGRSENAGGESGGSRDDDEGASELGFAAATLISFVPGGGLEQYSDGIGKRLAAGKHVKFQVHYTPTGRPETDRSKLGLWFNKTPVTHEVLTTFGRAALDPTNRKAGATVIVEGAELRPTVEDGQRRNARIPNIPPYADNWRIVSVMPVTDTITVHTLLPHMHLRGKDMTWYVTWPDGRKETLLSVPKYDFNWQIPYEFEKPITLPAGSTLTAVAHYDNSVKNRYNPAPEKQVFWSEQSWDEMFIPYMEYTVDRLDLTRPPTETQQPH
jgi:hypothetical protein